MKRLSLALTAIATAAACSHAAPAANDRRSGTATAVFERNEGQAPAEYAFLARHVEHEFAFAPDVVRIAIQAPAEPTAVAMPAEHAARMIDLRFDGGRPSRPVPELPLEGRITSRRGDDPNSWVTNVPTYERLRYADVYDRIDAIFYTTGPRVEYDLIVQPHADPSAIAIRFDGATRVRIENGGDLVVEAGDRMFVQRKPTAYQTRGGTTVPVRAEYRLAGERVGFMVGTYDPTEPLVID
jgi:hypothetical protein